MVRRASFFPDGGGIQHAKEREEEMQAPVHCDGEQNDIREEEERRRVGSGRGDSCVRNDELENWREWFKLSEFLY